MIGTTFASYIRNKTKTNSTTLTDADLLVYANTMKDMLAEMITDEVDEDFFQIELLRDLEEDKRFYSFPNDMVLSMKMLEAKLDGSNWSLLEETDLNTEEIKTSESDIRDAYTGKDPEYDIQGRGFFLLTGDAISDVTEGLKLKANVYPENLTASDLAGAYDLSVPQDPSSELKHAMPRAMHRVWADLVVIEYKNSKPKPIALNDREKNIDTHIELALDRLKQRNKDRSVVGSVPRDTGHDY